MKVLIRENKYRIKGKCLDKKIQDTKCNIFAIVDDGRIRKINHNNFSEEQVLKN